MNLEQTGVDVNKDKDGRRWGFAGGTCVALVLLFLVSWLTNLNHEGTSVYPLLLFSIPLLLQILIIVVLAVQKSEYIAYISIAMAMPYLLCLLAWEFYLREQLAPVMSWGCIALASLTMAMIFGTVWSIMREKSEGVWKHLLEEMKKRSFAMICIFLMAFISITYLLSFALAFHDKFERGRGREAIHYAVLGRELIEEEPYESRVGPQNRAKSDSLTRREYKIFFDEGSSIVDSDKNNRALGDMVEYVKKSCINSKYENVRVVLKGNCSREPTAEDKYRKYSSNYELSQARAQNVKWELQKGLGTKIYKNNVEWIILSMSNERAAREHGDWRVVDVIIEKPSECNYIAPTLLDYKYFTIYTITTTGYGDIIPVTSHAKFITSIANIFEVFFIVIFFNALFTLGREKP